jgi:hypothetical protein
MPDDEEHERRRRFPRLGRHEREHQDDERERRLIRPGDAYTADELDRGEVELEQVPPRADPPPEETRGEPWGWTKGPPYPRGWREDGRYSERRADEPGPLDGAWPGEDSDGA